MKKSKKNIRVAVAMSGGVDSSVVAALLKKQGYDVTGIFMHFWSEGSDLESHYQKATNKCCSIEAQEQVRLVAKKLEIPFYVRHFEKQFKKYVVDHFIDQYEKGFTPNPCVMCNKTIKFEFLLNNIKGLGFDYLATGHYITKAKRGGKFVLKKGADQNKDQSYFLYNIKQDQLKSLMFPLGKYRKPAVRKLAKKFELPTAERAESQGICFVLEKDHNNFLKKYLKNIKPGDVYTIDGEKVGKHNGLQYYTKGQRRGIMIASKKPYYVVDLDYKTNRLIVTDKKTDKALYASELECNDVTWVRGVPPKFPLKADVTIRYRHKPVKSEIIKSEDNKFKIKFKTPQRAVMPGQSVVFYKGKELVGGGIITN